jgi:hypothetical protein
VREPKRSSRLQREISVLFKERYTISAGADIDARAERPEGHSHYDWTGRRPPVEVDAAPAYRASRNSPAEGSSFTA